MRSLLYINCINCIIPAKSGETFARLPIYHVLHGAGQISNKAQTFASTVTIVSVELMFPCDSYSKQIKYLFLKSKTVCTLYMIL
jgi:hypothetical protein